MDIEKNIRDLLASLPSHVRLVAVSKTKPPELIMKAYNAGQRIFGENKAIELKDKAPLLPSDIEWHFIGHLQRNKVKYIAPFVSLIHSVDSLRLLEEIDRQAHKEDRVLPCLLQFHIASEESKFGLSAEEAYGLLDSQEYQKMRNVEIRGVMGMATFTDDLETIRKEFIRLHGYFNLLKSKYFANSECFKEISMGMSDDFNIAIEEGSTMVRIGSLIFGQRS